MSIEVLNISKRFGGFTALNDVSLKINSGELMVLLGPSGSGKTTLLRVIAGLEAPDSGSVLIQGDDATSRHVRERRVGFVFQHYALFRHMTVYENVAFGLRVRPRKFRPTEQEIRARVLELLKLVQLEQLANRFPSQLSGGQRQRVALARALAVEPRVLLLDEPFGALDAKVRKELRRWLRGLHDQMRITSVFVTHDQEEALEVADRVVVMNNGQIEQLGTPQEVYESPVTSFVYEFLGNVNLFHGRVDKGSVQFGDLSVEAPEYEDARNAGAVGYVRPHDIEIEPVVEQPEPVIAAAATPPPSRWERIRNRLKAVFPFRRLKTLARTEPEAAAQVPRQQVATPGTIRVTLLRSSGIGPMVRLELNRTDNGESVEAEISRERYRQLELHVGQHLDIRVKNVKVFLTPTGLNAPDGQESGESSAA